MRIWRSPVFKPISTHLSCQSFWFMSNPPYGCILLKSASFDDFDNDAFLKDNAIRRVRHKPKKLAGKMCRDWFEYWRAPDAHGVTCTKEQAIELLQEVLGVEVEIEVPNVERNEP